MNGQVVNLAAASAPGAEKRQAKKMKRETTFYNHLGSLHFCCLSLFVFNHVGLLHVCFLFEAESLHLCCLSSELLLQVSLICGADGKWGPLCLFFDVWLLIKNRNKQHIIYTGHINLSLFGGLGFGGRSARLLRVPFFGPGLGLPVC